MKPEELTNELERALNVLQEEEQLQIEYNLGDVFGEVRPNGTASFIELPVQLPENKVEAMEEELKLDVRLDRIVEDEYTVTTNGVSETPDDGYYRSVIVLQPSS